MSGNQKKATNPPQIEFSGNTQGLEKEYNKSWKLEQKRVEYKKKSAKDKLDYIDALQKQISSYDPAVITKENREELLLNIFYLGKAQYNLNTQINNKKVSQQDLEDSGVVRINYWKGQNWKNFKKLVLDREPTALDVYISKKSGAGSPFSKTSDKSPVSVKTVSTIPDNNEDQDLTGLESPPMPLTPAQEEGQAELEAYIEEETNKLTESNQIEFKRLLADSPPQEERDVDNLLDKLPKTEDDSGGGDVRIPDEGEGLTVIDIGDGEDAVKAVAESFVDNLLTEAVTEQEPATINPQPVQVEVESEAGTTSLPQDFVSTEAGTVVNTGNPNPSFEAGTLNQQNNLYEGVSDAKQPTPEIEQDAGLRSGGGGKLDGVLSNLDKGVTSEFANRRKEGLSISKLKDDIKSFHKLYDSLIPVFKTAEHQAKYKQALKSNNKREILQHYEEMETAIANYYKNDSGFKLGVIISAESLFSGGLQNLQALGAVNSIGGTVKDTSSFERGGIKAYEGVADVEPTFTRGGVDHFLQKPVANRVVKGRKRQITVDKNIKIIPTQVFSQYNHILNRRLNPVADFKIKGRKNK